MVKPQLPASTVVTPCSGDGVRAPSQKICASKWVCTSTKPGATTLPVASMVRAASPSTWPMATMRPSFTPTSARRRARAGAVDDVAAADDQIEHGSSPSSWMTADMRGTAGRQVTEGTRHASRDATMAP